MCAIKEGARPALPSSTTSLGLYGWHGNTNPLVVLDIPQGWCVESVRMTFVALSSIPTLSLSVHSAEQPLVLAQHHLSHPLFSPSHPVLPPFPQQQCYLW